MRIKAKAKTIYLHVSSGNPQTQWKVTSPMFAFDTLRERKAMKPGGRFRRQLAQDPSSLFKISDELCNDLGLRKC